MGNEQSRSTDKRWFLNYTVAGDGGSYKTLNKLANAPINSTWRPGKKPLLVTSSADGHWALADKTEITGRKLRVVEKSEVGSFRFLLDQFGHCLVTDASVPICTTRKPIVSNCGSSLCATMVYLDLHSFGNKDGRMEIQVRPPASQGQTKYMMKNPPTWTVQGETDKGYTLYEFFPSGGMSGSSKRWVISARTQGLVGGVASASAMVGSASFSSRNRDTLKTFQNKTKWIIV